MVSGTFYAQEPIVGGHRLPGELAPRAEAAHVAADGDLLARRRHVAQARADERVDPLVGARLGDGDPARQDQPGDVEHADEFRSTSSSWCQ